MASAKTSFGFAAVCSKELRRFFTDKRMVITTILLPGLLIYAIYSVMGTAMQDMFSVDEDYQPQISVVDLPANVESYDAGSLGFVKVGAAQIDTIKEQIANKEADALVVFSKDFDDAVMYRSMLSGGVWRFGIAPMYADVSIYYNSTRPESVAAYTQVVALLDGYKAQLQPSIININPDGDLDLATEEDSTGMVFASMLPFLVMIMLFTGSMGLATESIAGEKERGTFATMLVTPLRRWELACGKIVSISIIALLAGISSFIGIALSLPQMLDMQESGVSAALYDPADYAFLLAVTLATVLLFVGMISVLSALAKSVKESATLVSPLMIIVMLIGAMGMFSNGAQTDAWFYLIPVYNSVQAMIGVFGFTYEPVFAVITVLANLAYTAVCVGALTWMFGNERIMFAR